MTAFDSIQHARVVSSHDEKNKTLTLELALVAWKSQTFLEKDVDRMDSKYIASGLVVALWSEIGGLPPSEYKKRAEFVIRMKDALLNGEPKTPETVGLLLAEMSSFIFPSKPSPEEQRLVMQTIEPKIRKLINEHNTTS